MGAKRAVKDAQQNEPHEPIDVQRLIGERAYQYFVERGFVHGHDVEDWLRAEAEISAELKLK